MPDTELYDLMKDVATSSINDRFCSIQTIDYSTSFQETADDAFVSSDSDERWFFLGISAWGDPSAIIAE